ncbi:hypothetical protein [Streptomyces sp. M92]|uniref:hypothetical protein n=1 Tax=Streptomyces sp. M92 TaxID=2944250 RepID=UPI003FA686A7
MAAPSTTAGSRRSPWPVSRTVTVVRSRVRAKAAEPVSECAARSKAGPRMNGSSAP